MGNGVYMALSGALVQEKRLNTASNNLANSNSMAFKSDDLVFKEYMNRAEMNYNSPDKVIPASFVQVAGRVTNHSQGPLIQTGNELDIAIDGKGFFLVENGDGLQITRNGSLIVGQDGLLKTKDGYNVMAKKGAEYAPIELGRTEEIIFSPDGNIFLKGDGKVLNNIKTQIEKMAIVDVADPGSLEKVKGGYYKVNGDTELIENLGEQPIIKQGFLERSNVNIIEEMTQLISLTRSFESSQKVIQAVDEMDSQAIDKLGSV